MAKKQKKPSLFGRLFGNRNKTVEDLMKEEQIQSPGKMMLNNFLHNKLGMTGLIIFLLILIFVVVGPMILPIDLGDTDGTQQNVPPSQSMLKVPSALDGNIQAIAAGPTFGVGCDKNGKVYMWGYTKITDTIDLRNIPEEVLNAKIVDLAAGYDHIVALDEDNNIYVWGNTRLGQDRIPTELKGKNKPHIIQIEAGNQFSGVVTDEGKAYFWGNGNMADLKIMKSKELQGHIKKIAIATYNYVLLMDDGSVVYAGKSKDNPFAKIPAALSADTVDIAASGETMAAIDHNGKIIVWGNAYHGEADVPQSESKPVELYGGRFHYTALMENGDVFSWGDDSHGQASVASDVHNADIETVYAGFYQNYAVDKGGKVHTWGLKGHLLGTDDKGRDVLTRIVNGGKVTMTVGAVAVVISLVIGVIMGGLAGYFGGKVDMVVMRISEVIGSLPFLPFALLLSAIIGTRISVELRMYLIMIVLGVLSWTGICRLVRAQILAEREKEFVIAAQAMGVREGSIIFRHILPNVLSILLVEATLSFATCMLTESSLSYLGFGISPPTPTWGNMLTGANNSIVIQQYWWRWVFPATIFGICTICINLIGDAIRDAVDPKSIGR
ncbi:MAG: ABC transporter permease subunit [Oscillospiraceae bacterium]|nr:ABC transporter permease subunit [Oscillospiraceae bacterium]MBR4192889.1 ABC transporter permease subunit [Oscillospiraceae bacterium]